MLKFFRSCNENEEQTKIEAKAKGYRLGEFKDFTNLVPEYALIWYSYDETRYNFHIVPAANTTIVKKIKDVSNLSEWINHSLTPIKILAKNIQIDNQVHRGQSYFIENKERINITFNHKWLEAHENDYEYLLLLGRLWHEGKYVNNSFGKIQFMRYPIEYNEKGENIAQINKINGGFFMMYPDSDEDGEAKIHIYKDEKGKEFNHCVYNPQDLDIDNPKKIAEEFVKFIKGELV